MSGATSRSTREACVIGFPIAHSRSPMIHSYWLKKYGIDGQYTAKEVAPEALGAFFADMRAGAYVGCNVTMPHKEAVLEHLDVVDPTAKALGAVNTIWVENGRLHGMNTDGIGFLAHLDQSVPDWRSRSGPGRGPQCTQIIGAGGAARAIASALLEAGFRQVYVANRSEQRARDLVFDLAAQFGLEAGHDVGFTGLDVLEDDIASLRLLVNATSLGMRGQPVLPKISWQNLEPSAIVYDIVYSPLETDLLASARARGLDVVDGLGMLLHQAAPGFEKWFGMKPEVTPELRAIIETDLVAAS